MKAKVNRSFFIFDFSSIRSKCCLSTFVEISYRTRSCKYYVVIPTSWLCSWFDVPAYGFTPDDFINVFNRTSESQLEFFYDFVKSHNLFK